MTELTDLSETDASNTNLTGANVAEGCAPSEINNAIRNLAGMLGRFAGAETIASAATADLGSVPGQVVEITGTAAITSFGTVKDGTLKFVFFTGAGLTLTYNASSMLLPGNTSILTKSGDTAVFVSAGSGNWRCLAYQRRASIPFLFIDEDDMASNSAVAAPSQQSVKAYVDNKGMDLLGTLTTTSGTSFQVTGIGTIYRGLHVEVDGVSFNASDYLAVALSSTNGSSYGATRQMSPTIADGDNAAGFADIGNIRSITSNGKGMVSAVLSASNVAASQVIQRLATDTAAACNAIRFTANGGSAFDAGTIRVYGVR